jgi:HTH-type transcriptional regulator, glycine betaine synthesis regulator
VTAAADDAILKVADALGGLMEFWGFKRNMGRMWTVLYLASRALTAAELAQRLQLSAGAVSMTLTELANWGVVKKAWVPGDRRDYWEPETSIWKMVSRVFRERELRKIQSAIETFRQAIDVIEASREAAPEPERAGLVVALDRIRSLHTLAEIGNRLLISVLDGKPVDVSPLSRFRDG